MRRETHSVTDDPTDQLRKLDTKVTDLHKIAKSLMMSMIGFSIVMVFVLYYLGGPNAISNLTACGAG